MPSRRQVLKSQEEVIKDLKSRADFQQRIKFVKEKFWPALCAASMNIEDACMLLSGFNDIIMQEFLGLMKEKKLRELKLESKLDAKSPKAKENQELLELFQDCDIFEAKQYIEGMRNEIETFKRDEFQDRPLSSLKTKWIDELGK